MNKGVNATLFTAMALAALRFFSGGQSPRPAAPVRPTTSSPASALPTPTAALRPVGGCTAYTASPQTGSPVYPKQYNYGSAKEVIDSFFRSGFSASQAAPAAVQYAIAVVPDPHHTNLSLMFDRQMVAIEQAAQDEGYTFNSSWLPWASDSQTYNRVEDQQRSSDLTAQQEACPGVLLFRKTALETGAPSAAQAYANSLVVFIVGEQPTAGVNRNQWDNAVQWLSVARQTTSANTLRVLGPTFSGSVVSLARAIDAMSHATSFQSVQVLSGSVSTCASIEWFQHQVTAVPKNFGTFQESDSLQVYRFLSYIGNQNVRPDQVAVISEDETAYGQHPQTSAQRRSQPTDCDIKYNGTNQPLRLYYPRDMSAVRAQYQKESIFNDAGGPAAHQARSMLQDAAEAGDSSGQTADTIPTYSGSLTAIAQESVLYGIVNDLRSHHPRYLLLRCTNPLDSLFLTRFFHITFPQARIVVVGQDLLFSRAVDTTEFRGVLSLTNYPLLPNDEHWSLLIDDPNTPHSHRVFESQVAQGTYFAGRYSFDPAATPHPSSSSTNLAFDRKTNLAGYTDPYWLAKTPPLTDGEQAAESNQAPKTSSFANHPPTWLSVVGRDGFWPLAILNADTTPHPEKVFDPTAASPPSTMVELTPSSLPLHYSFQKEHTPDRPLLFSLPLSWNIFAIVALGLFGYQFYGMQLGERVPSSGIFSIFRPRAANTQKILLCLSCLVVLLVLLQLVSVSMALPSLNVLSEAYTFVGFAVVLVAAIILLILRLQTELALWQKRSLWLTLLSFATAYAVVWFHLLHNAAANLPLFYRMAHLTSGVSPLLPVLFLSIGFYLCSWQAMAGNLLLCDGRPLLPDLHLDMVNDSGIGAKLYRLGKQMDGQILRMARPLSGPHEVLILPVVITVCVIFLYIRGLPLLGLEGYTYTLAINCALLLAFALSMVESTRLFNTWLYITKLLSALSGLRLRRTLARLRAVPATSLWGMSGNVQRIQYGFFGQQLDAARRLSDLNKSATTPLPAAAFDRLQFAVECGKDFMLANADKLTTGPLWQVPVQPRKTLPPQFVREIFAASVEDILNQLLMPFWSTEDSSMCLDVSDSANPATNSDFLVAPLSPADIIRTAEEFVCLHYIAYIQNLLARVRTMVLSLAGLFVSVCFAISFYPFVPRTQIAVWMMVDLLFITAIVVYVYSGMERDETLSFITHTQPGKLGSEFWFKVVAFLTGPILGVITTQFPAISDSILGWLQPGLDALKP